MPELRYYDMLHPAHMPGQLFDLMLSYGWYPMQQAIFTTSHLDQSNGAPPSKVKWLRFDVGVITSHKSHRRILRKNSMFDVRLIEPFEHSDEIDRLYEKYISAVDFEGYEDIQSASFLRGTANIYNSHMFVVRCDDRPIAGGLFHTGDNSAASILHFYDPEYADYSPGKYLMLLTVDYCRHHDIQWYYPGYIIEGNPRMDYKLFLGRDVAEYYVPDPDPVSGKWVLLQQ